MIFGIGNCGTAIGTYLALIALSQWRFPAPVGGAATLTPP